MSNKYQAPSCNISLLFPGDSVLLDASSTEPFTEFEIDPASSPSIFSSEYIM